MLINLSVKIFSTFALKCATANFFRHKIHLTCILQHAPLSNLLITTSHPSPPPLTSDNELALVLYSGSLVACDAGVVAVVHQCEVGDAKGAGEVYVVYGDTEAGWYRPTILLPGDEDGLVT